MRTPRISVIIPTLNRAALLSRSLDSLARQGLHADRFEVVVVDDGSTDDTAQVCERHARRLQLRRIYQQNSGIAAAKNAGVLAAAAPIVFFFDDDDVATPHLLEEHLETHAAQTDDRVAVLGYTTWHPTLTITPVMEYVTDIGQFLFAYRNLKHGQVLDYTHFWGGRSSCKRAFLMAHGLFDEQFRFGSEDIELGFRLSRHGLKVVFNRKAVSQMIRPITFDEFCLRCEKQGRSQHQFARLHPEREVQDWCMVRGAEEIWEHAKAAIPWRRQNVYFTESMLRHGLAPARAAECMRLLHNQYPVVFTALKYKGIVEARAERRASVASPAALPALPAPDAARLAAAIAAAPAPAAPTREILVADPFLPIYDRSGGHFRLLNILKILVELNCRLTYIARHALHAETYLPVLQDLGVETYVGDAAALEWCGQHGFAPGVDIERLLTTRRYAIALLSHWDIAEHYLPLIRTFSPRTRAIVDSVDIHFLRETREAELKRDEQLKRQALERGMHEIAVYRSADRVWTVTGEDKRVIERMVDGTPIDIVPNVHPVVERANEYEKTDCLSFVGNFMHQPNVDSMVYCCAEIMPLIARELPEVQLLVVGNDPPPAVRALAGKNVVVTGYVDDLLPILERTRVSIAPLRYGAGMKGKIGEAASHGIPVVTTAIGAEGMGLVHGRDVLIAEEPAAFAAEVVRLYRDRELWERLARAGKAAVEAQWSPAAVKAGIAGILEQLDPQAHGVRRAAATAVATEPSEVPA